MVEYKKTVLSNGIRVISELQTHTRAVSIGVWITTGTRDESSDVAGVSHFLEHLVFKGTNKRSAFQIAKALEEVGGELNAYTTREYTCYHTLMLKDHWIRGLDVLADLTCRMKLRKDQFDLEKSVVLQELAASEENHEDHIYDEFLKRVYHKNSLGAPILGNEKSITQMKIKDVESYYSQKYQGPNIIISCAGPIDHDTLVEKVEKYFQFKKQKNVIHERVKPKFNSFFGIIEKQADQVHLLMGLPAASFKDKLRFEAFIVNALLGGGMTSRLFQSIRERKGLAYTIYSALNTFTDTGFMSVYSAVEKKNLKKLLATLTQEFNNLHKRNVKQTELKLFKTQVTGSILLGSEDVESRMASLAVNEMAFGAYKPVSEVIREIEAVTMNSINEYIEKYLINPKFGILLLGSDIQEFNENNL